LLDVKIEGADEGNDSDDKEDEKPETKGPDLTKGIGGFLGKKEEVKEKEQETIDDRVFVCLGKTLDGLKQ